MIIKIALSILLTNHLQ